MPENTLEKTPLDSTPANSMIDEMSSAHGANGNEGSSADEYTSDKFKKLSDRDHVRVTNEEEAAAAGPPEPTEHHGQIGPRHLLAGPVGIGSSEFGWIGLDPLHPTADVGENRGHKVLDCPFIAGDARDTDQPLEVPDRLRRVNGLGCAAGGASHELRHGGSAVSCTSARRSH